jgi:hypothetical protein
MLTSVNNPHAETKAVVLLKLIEYKGLSCPAIGNRAEAKSLKSEPVHRFNHDASVARQLFPVRPQVYISLKTRRIAGEDAYLNLLSGDLPTPSEVNARH